MSIGTLTTLPIADLHAHPSNPRIDYGVRDGLTASIAQRGIIQPLTVTADPAGGHIIVAGHRRHASATDAGLTEVPCIIVEADTANDAATMVHENVHRDGLTAAELARGIQGMLDAGVSVKDTAKGMGLKAQSVNDLSAAAHAPAESLVHLHAGHITLEDALVLSDIHDTHPDIYSATIEAMSKSDASGYLVKRALTERAKSIAAEHATTIAADTGVSIAQQRPYAYDGSSAELADDEIAEHQGLACYVIYPNATRDGEAVVEHWCTKTKAHKTGSTKAAGGTVEHNEEERAARRRVIANNKAWVAANASRTTYQDAMFTANTAVAKKHSHLMTAANLLHPYDRGDASKGLDRATKAKANSYMTGKEAAKHLASDSLAQRAQLFAIVAAYESHIDKGVWRNESEGASIATYLTLMGALGYPLTPPETHLIEQQSAGKSIVETDYPV